MARKIDKKKKIPICNTNNCSTKKITTDDRVRCIHYLVLPFKDFGRCNNENNARYKKPVFEHECQYKTVRPLPCRKHKFHDISVYKKSILQPTNVTRVLAEDMVKVLLFPKNRAIDKWKKAIRVYLKDILYRTSTKTGEQNGKSIVTALHYRCNKVLNLLNKDTTDAFTRLLRSKELDNKNKAVILKNLKGNDVFKTFGFSMKQYKDRKAVHWQLLLNNEIIADTKDGKMFG